MVLQGSRCYPTLRLGGKMSNRIYICSINTDYLDYLRQFDDKVSEDKKQNRKFVGVLLEINEKKYYAPLSSPKSKHKSISDKALDIFKIDGGRLGVINLNNMIPVPDTAVIRLDIENEPDEKYKNLLRNQAKIIHSKHDDIKKKAKRLYGIVNSGSQPILNSRCCNYKLLESKILDFETVIKGTADEVAVAIEDINSTTKQIVKGE